MKTDVAVPVVNNRVTISTRKQFRMDKRQRRIPEYTQYSDLIKYAQSYQRSHKLEEHLAYQLQKLGLNAEALPSKADGDTKSKQADILITTANGQKLTLEVKEARHSRCTLGLPVETSFTTAYERYPVSLLIDSCNAWDSKEIACERRDELLLGAVILCPISRLSDEDFSVLGAVYCPTSDWSIRETCNRGRYYDAYVAKRKHMRTIADLLEEVNSYA